MISIHFFHFILCSFFVPFACITTIPAHKLFELYPFTIKDFLIITMQIVMSTIQRELGNGCNHSIERWWQTCCGSNWIVIFFSFLTLKHCKVDGTLNIFKNLTSDLRGSGWGAEPLLSLSKLWERWLDGEPFIGALLLRIWKWEEPLSLSALRKPQTERFRF